MSQLKSVSLVNIQGHRGARGLFPENTTTAFIEAIKLGVHALEMDVVISADNKVVVSHEPWMNADFCSLPNGEPVEKKSQSTYNLYKMPYDEIATYDCGKRGNAEFPFQKAMPERKPLLSEVIDASENYIQKYNLPPVNYTIEIKSDINDESIFQPEPKTFVDLVYQEIKQKISLERVCIQSFDVRILREMKKKDGEVTLAFLVENNDGLQINMNRLGFIPQTYSPEYIHVTTELAKQVHKLNMQLVVWTVNELSDMKSLIALGVDGLISDYPNRALELMRK
jgi:glycerophosphoryl diester phosphodiesterase